MPRKKLYSEPKKVVIEALKAEKTTMEVGKKYTIGLELAETLVSQKRAKIVKKLFIEPDKD